MKKGSEASIIGAAIIALLILAVGFAILLVSKGKAEELGGQLGFSLCGETKSVDYNGFMGAIKNVYNNCSIEKKCGYELNVCENMVLTLPNGKSCYKIKGKEISEKVGTMFNDFIGATRIICKDNPISGVNNLIITNQYGNDNKYCNDYYDMSSLSPYTSYFTVAKNSNIRIRSKETSDILLGRAVDVDVEISGGDENDYASCEDAPFSGGSCRADSDCTSSPTENTHRYCNTAINQCTHSGYCQHICESGSPDCATAPNNPDNKACVKITASCTFNGACVPVTANCPAKGISTTINGLDGLGTEGLKFTLFETIPVLKLKAYHTVYGSVMDKNENYYFKTSNVLDYISDEKSKDIAMSLAFANYDANNGKVTLYMGCY